MQRERENIKNLILIRSFLDMTLLYRCKSRLCWRTESASHTYHRPPTFTIGRVKSPRKHSPWPTTHSQPRSKTNVLPCTSRNPHRRTVLPFLLTPRSPTLPSRTLPPTSWTSRCQTWASAGTKGLH